jgi:hypothetical protein
MPVHDWTRVDAGIFHSFHGAWIAELTKVLNSGMLPDPYYALGEQVAGGIGPDVLTLSAPQTGGNGSGIGPAGATAVATMAPKVSLVVRAEIDEYALKQRTLVIRHSSNHRIVALLEIVSPGNKSNRHAVRALLDKVAAALALGIHLLVVDLFPPGPRDPHGIHGLIWDRLTGDPHEQPADRPLTLAAYTAGPVKTAYVEPVRVGQVLPDMPLFLTGEEYVNVPLETTYQAAWAGVPRWYRDILERPA